MKFDTTKIKPISGLDATFLYIETPTSPMHIGGVSVIEGSLDFESFRATILSRIHMVPKLRKRLVYVPLSIDYPYWVDDPHFDIDLHIHHMALPRPGNWKTLRKVASQIFSKTLDQSRPLWSFTFVEGLDNIPQVPKGSIAVISKVHHVAMDGITSAGLLGMLYDFSAEKTEIPEPKPYNPEPLPNEFAMMLKSSVSFIEKPLKLPKIISEAISATFKAGVLTRVNKLSLPTAPFTAPPSILNGIISANRKWNTAILSLERVKALKNHMETSLNDVMLAICAGALRKYLLEKNKLPEKPLVAMVPVSTRSNKAKLEPGNQVSSILVQLATHIEDPVERLEVIHENSIREKTYHGAIGAKTLANMAEAVPFGIANQAARLYSRYNLSEWHNPVFNLTITNVPGPPFPLYINGHKLLSVMGTAPILDGMGLIITIFSYNGLITISPTSDSNTMPDLDVFTKYLRESANQLEAAILDKKEMKKPAHIIKRTLASASFFKHIKEELKNNPDKIQSDLGLFQFMIDSDENHFWSIDLNKSPGVVRRGKMKSPDVTISISDEYFFRIGKGELSFKAAQIQGRVKIEGDIEKSMNIIDVLAKMPKL